MDEGQPFRVVLSGPGTETSVFLTVSVRESEDADDLFEHLERAFPDNQYPRWQPAEEYGHSYVFGDPNQDVTPFLLPLAEWLKGRNVSEVVVIRPSPERLVQVRSVFPEVVVR